MAIILMPTEVKEINNLTRKIPLLPLLMMPHLDPLAAPP